MAYVLKGEQEKKHDDGGKGQETDDASKLSLDSNGFVCDYSSLHQSRDQTSTGEEVEEKFPKKELLDDDQISCDSVNTLDQLCAANKLSDKKDKTIDYFQPFDDITTREPDMKLRILKLTALIPSYKDKGRNMGVPRLSAPTIRASTTMKGLDTTREFGSENQVKSSKVSPRAPRLPRYMLPTESFLHRIRPELAPSPPHRVPAKWIKEVDPHSLPNYMKLTEAAKGHYKESIKPVLNATNSAPHPSRVAPHTSSVLRTFDPDSYDRIHAVKEEDVVILKEIRRVLAENLMVDQRRRESSQQPECVSIKKYTGPLPPIRQTEKESRCTAPVMMSTVLTAGKSISTTSKPRPMISTNLQVATSKKQTVTSKRNKPKSLPRYMQPTEASRRREEENRKERIAKGLMTIKDMRE